MAFIIAVAKRGEGFAMTVAFFTRKLLPCITSVYNKSDDKRLNREGLGGDGKAGEWAGHETGVVGARVTGILVMQRYHK